MKLPKFTFETESRVLALHAIIPLAVMLLFGIIFRLKIWFD